MTTTPPPPTPTSPPPTPSRASDPALPSLPYREPIQAPWVDVILAAGLVAITCAFVDIEHSSLAEASTAAAAVALVFMALAWVICLVCLGGFRLEVNRERVRVRCGWLRIPVMSVPFRNIAGAEPFEFSALRQFGGYGIRYGKPGWGFVLRDNGVRLTTRKGTRVTLSVRNPERIAGLINAARRAAGGLSQ